MASNVGIGITDLARRGMIMAIGMALASTGGCSDSRKPVDGDVERVTLAGRSFDLDLAMATESRTRGLGGRDSLASDGGMFFVFPDARPRRFWMYDCLIPIDIAFIDPLGYVTSVHTMPTEPPRGPDESIAEYEGRLPGFTSGYPAQFAIELSPGMFESLGIGVGDRVSIPRERLKALGQATEPEF
ncbi:MAG: hypothetical protein CMJ23_01980 [Phycisphaerae bacterium]|nr:hypothetical protein [Phycisphaerae bacterium]